MAEMKLYPKNLKGLDLSFEESIYAIAFELEDEILANGKEAVFGDLGMTADEMKSRVEYCLDKKMSKEDAYALRRVLGDLEPSASDLTMFGRFSLEGVFESVVAKLRGPDDELRYGQFNYKMLLAQHSEIPTVKKPDEIASDDAKGDAERLYAEVYQLMNEVRTYDEKRERALARIEALLVEVKQRKDCPRYLEKVQPNLVPEKIDLDGLVSQIFWPYRSNKVLHKLCLTTMGEAVAYFQDFENFVEGGDITLMEWSVIVSILRRRGLLSGYNVAFGLNDRIEELKLSVRMHNCLKRVGINTFDDMLAYFANGAADGWDRIEKIRNLGRKTYEEVIRGISKITIELDESLCFLTKESEVLALDFGYYDRIKLQYYDLNTIGDLLSACADENRFAGLRYVDHHLYLAAKEHLKRYGFA